MSIIPPRSAAIVHLKAQGLSKASEGVLSAATHLVLSPTHTRCERRRKVGVSEFKGKTYVNIREYYTKDGKDLPGAKGISLPPDQWHALQAGLPALLSAVKAQQEELA